MPRLRTGLVGVSSIVFLALVLCDAQKFRARWPLENRSAAFQLVQYLQPVRLLEARLSGFHFSPHSEDGTPSLDKQRLRSLARDIRQETSHRSQPDAIRAEALLSIAAGRLDEAAERLRLATLVRPGDPTLLNDFAAVQLARAKELGETYPAIEALEAAGRAKSHNSEAMFNYALALEELHLYSEARRAWREVINSEAEDTWRDEAMSHLVALRSNTRDRAWKEQVPKVEQAVFSHRGAVLRQIVTAWSQEAMILAQETLLAEWGSRSLVADQQGANRALVIASAIGETLSLTNGEEIVADSIDSIMRVSAAAPPWDLELAEGHVLYTEGRRALATFNTAEANELFTKAKSRFDSACSPMRFWARYWLAVADFYADRSEAAMTEFTTLLHEEGVGRYGSLVGRTHWAIGLIALRDGRFGDSLINFRAAAAIFAKMGENENLGAVEALLAEGMELLGDPGTAWKHRGRALALLAPSPDAVPLHNLLLECSRTLLKEGQLHASLAFQDEDLAHARNGQDPITLAELMLLRGKLHAKLGRPEEALLDVAAGRQYITEIPDQLLAKRLSADAVLFATQTSNLRGRSAREGDLSEAIDTYRDQELTYHAGFAHLLRAEVRWAQGEAKGASEDFERSLDLFKGTTSSLKDSWARDLYFEQWQDVFDKVLELYWEQGATAQTFASIEHARGSASRALLGRNVVTSERPTPEILVSLIRSKLPRNTIIIEYALLPERLLTFVVTAESFVIIPSDVTTAQLQTLVTEFDSILARRASLSEVRRVGARLFDVLLRPALTRVPSHDQVVIVPDKFLASLPFGGLFDSRRLRYLAELHTLWLSPSASTAVLLLATGTASAQAAPRTVAAVGNPQIGDALPTLSDLRGADKEAKQIATLYPSSTLLLGASANVPNFVEAASRSEVLHFGGHSSRAGAVGEAFIVLAPSEETPAGLLFSREIADLDLTSLRVAVFSACRAAAGASTRTQGISQLSRSLLAAGAQWVASSLWDVDDRMDPILLLEFHRGLLVGWPPPVSLRLAQLEMLQQRRPELRHPGYWATLQLVGGLEKRERRVAQ